MCTAFEERSTRQQLVGAGYPGRIMRPAQPSGNGVASIARLLGVSQSTIYLEGFYLSSRSRDVLIPPAHLSVLG